MDSGCCELPLTAAGQLQLSAALLAGALLSAALVRLLSGSWRDADSHSLQLRRRRADQCTSLDCARCWDGAAAARRALRRLDGAYCGQQRLGAALRQWGGAPDGGLMIDGLSDGGGGGWWEVAQLPKAAAGDVRLLESQWRRLRAEYRHLLASDHAWTHNQTPAGSWRVFWVVNQGVTAPTAALCPHTCLVLDQLRTAMRGTIFSNVCFSVLEPGTCIEPHLGPTNARIRCHLALEVPAEAAGLCQLTVADQPCRWKLGRCLLFDDSFLHWAENLPSDDSRCARAVLMVDLWHPRLTAEERAALADVLRPAGSAIQHAAD